MIASRKSLAMKKPNLEDFDINAKPRALGSPLDGMPSIQKPLSAQQVPPSPQEREEQEVPERANAPTVVRANGKRIITRNSFEIFEDQMDSLRERSFQEKRRGTLGSMSAMVRDAIDEYLRKHPLES
jgi:hypothetical protein